MSIKDWEQIVQAYAALLKAGVELPPWLDFATHWVESNRPELCVPAEEVGRRAKDNKQLNKLDEINRAMNKTCPRLSVAMDPLKLGPFPPTKASYIAIALYIPPE